MNTADQAEEHLDAVIALAMGGESPAIDPAGVDAPTFIPLHDSAELPADCRGAEATRATADASPEELTRHAQYLEWRAGLLSGEATALRLMAAPR